ncbi:MAG: ATP-binding protein [Candidatus Cloacimonetes bacterium]|nr:ATP-binding protein [Candidatus Cloacimonadota bacterium]
MIEFPWEDNLLERKTESDLKDLIKTLVAFSNSVQPGHRAVLLIGEKDDGKIQGVKDPDNIQKRIRKECDKIYPTILWSSKVYKKENKFCIRVEIEYSGETPHFGGSSWIRKGSENIKASDEVFQRLIDLRSNIITEISKWFNKEVTIHGDQATVPNPKKVGYFGGGEQYFSHRWKWEEVAKIVFINNYWVTFEKKESNEQISEPLNKLTLSFDNENERLKVIVDY